MECYDIFPTTIGSFEFGENTAEVNADIISKLEKEKVIDNYNGTLLEPNMRSHQTDHYLHKDEKYSTIIDFIKKSVEEYKENFNIDCDRLDITICWGNKYPAYTQSHQVSHTHRMSYLSGVYFLTTGAPLYFDDPVSLRTENSLEVTNNLPRRNLFSATPGNLLIFPSWLKHGTVPHSDTFDRWTISFNLLPAGNVNQKSNNSKNPSCILEVK